MTLLSYFKTLIFLAIILTTFSSIADERKVNSYTEDSGYQVYVTIDQLVVSNEGIYVNLENLGLIPVKSLTWLQDGLCLIVTYKDPECGHVVYCPTCRGCDPRNRCPWRCKCPPRR